MASSIVSSAARQLGKLLIEEAKYLYAVKDKVEALHEELSWMHTFLQDADSREDEEEIIRMWVSQIKDFAYEAEDIVEKYLHRVSRHRQEGILNTFRWFSCICCDCRSLHGVGSDIDRLKQKISELSTRMHIYGVKPKSAGDFSHKKRVLELRRTSSRINRDMTVGLEDDTSFLVEKLANSNVVCVTGMGGLGKTTLAKMVYEEMKEEFKNRVWVYVSQQFQTRNILEAILVKLSPIGDLYNTSRNIKNLRDEDLPSEVSKVLKEKKCLVVLDDIWRKEAWDTLAPAFRTFPSEPSPSHPLRGSQSKLLLTTRNTELLLHVDSTGYNHTAKFLEDEDSWRLLKKICSSVGNTSDIGTDMEDLGRQMAKHCNGLPLAVVVLGGILAAKSSLDEWKIVQKNIDSCLKSGSSSQDNLSISQVLELSFDDLPYYLKPCFLHLGNFPEDYEIPTKTLYHMWAVEGIVAQPVHTTAGEVSVEAIAEKCLKELANRCLVQLDTTGKVGKIKSCRLHDLIRDMCLEKSNEESFLKVIQDGYLEKESSSNNSSSSQMTKRFRRLVVYMHKSSRSIQDLISEQQNHHVRSLLFFPAGQAPRKLTWTQRKVSGSLKLVRVLHFDNVCIRSLPDEIGDLIHLRYLSLKGTRVSLLPRSVGKLKYLQILDLRVCECIIVMLPNVLWKLERLKHLYLPNSWVLFECFDNTLKLGGLIQLETLINLRLEKCRVRDLLRLVKLRKVSLADYTVTDSKCLNSFLEFSNNTPGQLKRPLSLALDAKVISMDPGILSSNSQLQFHKLHISGKILLKLRYARIFPQDLKQLTLNESEFKDDPMPILERLSHLTELTLGQRTFLGATMVCTLGKFPQLAILRLVQLPNLQEWVVERGAMPNLKNLYIYSCEKLEMVPSELPTEVKIGCRPCVTGYDKYGSCCYTTQQAPAAS